jgi:hypothetical protein
MNQVSRFFLLFLSCFVASICEARRDTQRKQSGTPTRWGSVAGGFCLSGVNYLVRSASIILAG